MLQCSFYCPLIQETIMTKKIKTLLKRMFLSVLQHAFYYAVKEDKAA